MNSIRMLTSFLFLTMLMYAGFAQEKKYVMVIHGGAGTILKSNMSAEKEAAYKAALTEALKAGFNALHSGKTSRDAVKLTILVLENSPLFNAGSCIITIGAGPDDRSVAHPSVFFICHAAGRGSGCEIASFVQCHTSHGAKFIIMILRAQPVGTFLVMIRHRFQ